ncbi:hypothetical protein EV368DRAFT_70237 [Lentinula lateritia]|nr:hypothetical protein EV368DRAFT_70237 [Lentinula lateritia]
MRLNIIYFVFGLSLGLFSNVWATALRRAYIHMDSEADIEKANKFLMSGLPYVFKKKPKMGFASDASIQIKAGSEPQSKRLIFFEIYADEQMKTLQGSGYVNQNLYALRVTDREGKHVNIGPDKYPQLMLTFIEANEAHFEDINGEMVVKSLYEQLSGLSLDPRS